MNQGMDSAGFQPLCMLHAFPGALPQADIIRTFGAIRFKV